MAVVAAAALPVAATVASCIVGVKVLSRALAVDAMERNVITAKTRTNVVVVVLWTWWCIRV